MRIDGWTLAFLVVAALFTWWGVAEAGITAYLAASMWVALAALNEVFARYL